MEAFLLVRELFSVFAMAMDGLLSGLVVFFAAEVNGFARVFFRVAFELVLLVESMVRFGLETVFQCLGDWFVWFDFLGTSLVLKCTG